MEHLSKQYEKLFIFLKYLKNNRNYFNTALKEYDLDIFSLEKIKKIYNDLHLLSKKEILTNLSEYVSPEFFSLFNDSVSMYNELMNISNLSGNHDKFIGSKNNPKKWMIETTSGTTGKPFPIIKSERERLIESSFLFKCRKQYFKDVNINNGFLMIHQTDPFLKSINYRGDNTENMSKVIDYMLVKKPRWIFSTALLIKKFCEYIIKNNRVGDIKKLDIEFIEVTSQKLDYNDKTMIETVFNSKTLIQYGCREVWGIAYECKCGNLHINCDYLMVDIVDENGKLIEKEGEIGEVVITSLTNKSLPFIKYHLGDLARIYNKKCLCGLETPILLLEKGRIKEKIINTSLYGNEIFRKVLRRLYFHENVVDINKIRIIQDGSTHLSVYVDKIQENDNLFERRFIEVSRFMAEELNSFGISFIYDYSFENDMATFKENIFISEISK